MNTKQLQLTAMANWTRIDQIASATVSAFSAEDDTPTLHLQLWRGVDLCDMPAAYSALQIVAEGHWEGGRIYSLQIV